MGSVRRHHYRSWKIETQDLNQASSTKMQLLMNMKCSMGWRSTIESGFCHYVSSKAFFPIVHTLLQSYIQTVHNDENLTDHCYLCLLLPVSQQHQTVIIEDNSILFNFTLFKSVKLIEVRELSFTNGDRKCQITKYCELDFVSKYIENKYLTRKLLLVSNCNNVTRQKQ